MNILYIISAFFTGISVDSIIALIIYNRTKWGEKMINHEIDFERLCDLLVV